MSRIEVYSTGNSTTQDHFCEKEQDHECKHHPAAASAVHGGGRGTEGPHGSGRLELTRPRDGLPSLYGRQQLAQPG
jgi:hypothetical protein